MSKTIKAIINVVFALVIALGAFGLGMRYDRINHTKLLPEEIYRMGIRDGVYSTLEVPYDRLDQACYGFLLDHDINPSYSSFYVRFQSEWFSFLQENGYCEAFPCDEIDIDSVENRLNY